MRIVTRPDFDGIVCAALLSEAETIDVPVKWVQPSHVQQGRVEIRSGDILANLPFHPACSLWFDHHLTNRIQRPFKGCFEIAPSAAGIVYRYYRGRFTRSYDELVAWADRIDAARLSMQQVRAPEKYPYLLLSMTVNGSDPQGEPYWNHLVDRLRQASIGSVMQDEKVRRHCRRTLADNRAFEKLLRTHTRVEDHVAVTDLRSVPHAPSGNRFLVYALFPEAHVSVKIRPDSDDPGMLAVSVGHSIFNPGCRVNAGLLLAAFGGGGHRGAAACRFPENLADDYLPKIIDSLRANLPNEPDGSLSGPPAA